MANHSLPGGVARSCAAGAQPWQVRASFGASKPTPNNMAELSDPPVLLLKAIQNSTEARWLTGLIFFGLKRPSVPRRGPLAPPGRYRPKIVAMGYNRLLREVARGTCSPQFSRFQPCAVLARRQLLIAPNACIGGRHNTCTSQSNTGTFQSSTGTFQSNTGAFRSHTGASDQAPSSRGGSCRSPPTPASAAITTRVLLH